MYENPTQTLKFSSGRTVGNLRKDAKKISKSRGKSYNSVLNELAVEHSYNRYLSWGEAIEGLKEQLCTEILSAKGKRCTTKELILLRDRHPKITQYGIECIRGNDFVVDDVNPVGENGLPNYLLDPNKSDDELFPYLERPFEESLKDENESLFHPGNMILFNRAFQFLDIVLPSRQINKNKSRHSYELKHLAEYYFRHFKNDQTDSYYLPNGVLIAAALHRGYLVERYGRSAYFNIDEDSLQKLEELIKQSRAIEKQLQKSSLFQNESKYLMQEK